jgi:hypothetical protein
VIDAMKLSLLEHRVRRADTVVFVDVPRRWCFLGVAQRDGLGALRNREFIRWIWEFPRETRPHIQELLERRAGDTRVVVLCSRRDVRRFLASLETRCQTPGHVQVSDTASSDATLRPDGAVVG